MRYGVPLMAAAAAAAILTGGVAMASTQSGPTKTVGSSRTASASRSACDAYQIDFSTVDAEPGTGHLDITLRIQNLDIKDSCTIPGLPKIALFDAKTGKTVANTSGFGSGSGITLRPKQSATMMVRTLLSGAPVAGGAKCTPAGLLELILPGKVAHNSTPDSKEQQIIVCNGLQIESPPTL